MKKNFNAFYHRQIAHDCKNLFEKGRLLAQRFDEDYLITIENQCLLLKNKENLITTVKIPHFIEANINFRGYLGFKSNGNSKSPGTLTLQNKNQKKEIRLGVGLAKWQLY